MRTAKRIYQQNEPNQPTTTDTKMTIHSSNSNGKNKGSEQAKAQTEEHQTAAGRARPEKTVNPTASNTLFTAPWPLSLVC